jgi:hypothetical protein
MCLYGAEWRERGYGLCGVHKGVYCLGVCTLHGHYYLFHLLLLYPPARSRLGKLCKLRAGTFFTALTYTGVQYFDCPSTFSKLYLETTYNRQLHQWRFRTSYTQTCVLSLTCPSMHIAQGFLGYGLCSVVSCLGFPAVHCDAEQDGRLRCSAMHLFLYNNTSGFWPRVRARALRGPVFL